MDNTPALPYRQPDPVNYWVEMIKCRHACPVGTDACGYVNAIAEGRYEEAYRLARATNPFASICGRVCGAPCEANCRRGSVDKPVTIRALKRFVTEIYGPETGDFTRYREFADTRMLPPDRGDFEKVAVIGAGVAGMTVAHDLAQVGYKVTVFEAHSKPGGMLTAGVPVFRLPRDLVDKEMEAILSLGVELKCNTMLGRDMTISSLRAEGYKAIFLGVGLPKGRKLPMPGADTPGVYDGLDFLRAYNEGRPMPIGRKIVVIGGGNVAYDVARSAVRPDRTISSEETREEMGRGEQIAFDVARSALRISGDKTVHIVCLENRDEMPADEIEVVEGSEEGIVLHNRRGPREVIVKNGKVAGLRVIRCVSVFDHAGKFHPTFDDTILEDIEADTIMFAIGQTSDLSFLKPEDGVESERGLIKVNRETYQTTAPDVFACGDIAHGPRLFIDAIASAHTAALSMHDFLRKKCTDVAVRRRWTPASYTMTGEWYETRRANPPVIDVERRAAGTDIVEERFPDAMAKSQASRCLRCNVNTVFNTDLCVACGGCIDVCPMNLISLMPVPGDPEAGMMVKDETTCIRCSLCATRCPTQAITMQRFDYYRECVSLDGHNPRINYGSVQ